MNQIIPITRRAAAVFVLTLGSAWVLPGEAMAASTINQSLFSGVAIDGTDPVAYFLEGRAVAGSSLFSHDWDGAEWHFTTAANRDAFAAAPEDFAPRFGGYCAWAVSQGYTADVDPEAWTIVDGALYLNYSKSVQATWSKDIPGNIAKAEANWPAALDN